MALRAVCFDVGETLVDEERWWRRLADRRGLQPHVVWAALGVTIARGEEHTALWGHLGIDEPTGWYEEEPYSLDDLYADALDCLRRTRALGLRTGIVGNQTAALEAWAREAALPADVISSSASLGVRKPEPEFYEIACRLLEVEPADCVFLDDLGVNLKPARAMGMTTIKVEEPGVALAELERVLGLVLT